MNKKKYLYLLFSLVIIVACSSSPENNIVSDDGNNPVSGGNGGSGSGSNNGEGNPSSSTWSIPKDQIVDGSGKDGIPSIDNPVFISADDSRVSTYMDDDDLVIGVKLGNVIKAYPHKILDWHEVVNDEFSGRKITINYCPLTGTAFAWEFKKDNTPYTFGVSGLLYKSNLILYDRETDSNWSQMELACVNGTERGKLPNLIQLVETNWKTWKNSYPGTEIMLNEQGFDRNYQIYPYVGYLDTDDFLIFPVKPLDNRLLLKERVHGLIEGGNIKAFRFQNFVNGNTIKDGYQSRDFLLVGNENVIKSFILSPDLKDVEFTYSYADKAEFFHDSLGNKWSIIGEAIEGPMIGRKLQDATSVTGFWFSLASFYPNPVIY